MTLNLFNDSMIHGDCDQCGRLFMFEGPGARERYQAAQREGGADLCKMCIAALHEGEYRWACEGCCAEVTGSLDASRFSTASGRLSAPPAEPPSLGDMTSATRPW